MIFNIVLHVIFLKLISELESISVFAIILILFTIGLNYILIVVTSLEKVGNFLDPDLVDVGQKSVLNLNSFVLLLGVSSLLLFFEKLPNVYQGFRQMCTQS